MGSRKPFTVALLSAFVCTVPFAVLLTLGTVVSAVSLGSDDTAASQNAYQPRIAPASADAERALGGFVVPEGMTAKLVAAEPQLANPVAMTVTADGRVFVCETFRQQKGVEDNRSHMNWLEQDLQLESIEEREAMFRRFMGEDVAAWTREHDRIRLLEDRDRDGYYETNSVFADGFNELATGTGAGVIEHQGTVYYTCIPKLWSLRDQNGDGVAEQRSALHHGYGVRVAFRGHDLHGLTIGPDGRLYFSLGDRGYNVITPEGHRLKRVDTGAVFRCDPDGSHLEVFAFGLRNPQELAFDDYGNLFTGDNNSDSGDQARLVYVVQDGDTGWRMYFQYLDDRGPWNREKIWRPWQFDAETTAVQPASILPPIINLADGPSGLTFYPGVGLPERYQGHFFLADFRGAAGNSGIRSFAVSPQGASFQLQDSHQFLWSILATDLDFAPDGSLLVSDWVNGWDGEGKGRIYRFADPEAQAASHASESARLLAGDIASVSTADLVQRLSHSDRRVRQAAQFELVRRNDVEQLHSAALSAENTLVARHGLWGVWQLGLSTPEAALQSSQVLLQLLKTPTSPEALELQAQALKILADLWTRHDMAQLPSTLRDELLAVCQQFLAAPEPRLNGFAAVAIGRLGQASAAVDLLTFLDRLNNTDPVARHQAVMGLVAIAERTPGLLSSMAGHPGSAGRLGLVLALRRQSSADVSLFLRDADPLVVAEAARAVNDEPIEAAQGALADLLSTPALEESTLRRAMNAAYRRGLASDATEVAAVAANASQSESLRLTAADLLRTWNRPQSIDTVTGRWRPLPARDVPGLQQAIRDTLPAMLAGPENLRTKTIEITTQLGISDLVPELESLLTSTESDAAVRLAAFRALSSLTKDIEPLMQRGLRDSAEPIRLAALELLVTRNPDAAVPELQSLLASGSLQAKQTSLRLLGKIEGPRAEGVLQAAFGTLQQGTLPAGAMLDLLTAAEQSQSSTLNKLAAEFRERQAAGSGVIERWQDCLEGGDPRRGRELFFSSGAASCRRCHKVGSDGGEVGPALTKIGKEKDRGYLLESIVDPNARIAKGYETVLLTTLEGRVHSGILRQEDSEQIQLMTSSGAIETIRKADIDERANGQSGMPQDLIKNLSRSEIRDLVAWLAELQDDQPAGH